MKVTGEYQVSQTQIEEKFSIGDFLGFFPPPFDSSVLPSLALLL